MSTDKMSGPTHDMPSPEHDEPQEQPQREPRRNPDVPEEGEGQKPGTDN